MSSVSTLLAAAATRDVEGILVMLVVVLLGAKLTGELVERIGQPAVLGELLVGIVLGNLTLLGGPSLAGIAQSETFTVLGELGAVLLLFEVGLESTPREMLAVGGAATRVAVVGVVAPMLLGFGLGGLTHPEAPWMVHAFLGAMLAATSVGITARVLKDAGFVRARAARIILGAAVIDDVLGLVVLAVVSGIITASASGEALGAAAVAAIMVKAAGFLVAALVVGSFLSPRLFQQALRLRTRGLVQALSLSLCFGLAWVAARAGLAPIVGAFAAGLVLEEVHFEEHVKRGEPHLHAALAPLLGLLVPVFFVRMGMLVDVTSFAHGDVLGFAVLLTLAAVVGKWVCGLVVPRGVSGLTVGLGMMPRGEVGLIFAGIGANLALRGEPVVDAPTYAAAVFMVVVTTVLTPPLLLWSLRRAEAASATATPPGPPGAA